MMNKQEVVAVIDRSGSMTGKEDDTIGGINSALQLLKKSKESDSEIKISIKLFDHEDLMLLRSVNIDDFKPITRKDYQPRGQTALLDAMGNTLSYFMEKKITDVNAFTSCLIYVVTDGLENCSKEFTKDKIKKMIKEAEENYNIKIVYLGANQDAIMEASKFGIGFDSAMNYDETSENSQAAYRALASVATRQRSGINPAFTQLERAASVTTTPPPSRRSNTEPPPLKRQQTGNRLPQ